MHQVFTPGTIHTENLQPSQLLTNLTTSHPQECHPSQERIGLIKRWGKNHHCPLQNSLTLEGLPEKFPWLHDPIRSKPSSDFVPASKSDEKFDVHHDADATRAFDNKKTQKISSVIGPALTISVRMWKFYGSNKKNVQNSRIPRVFVVDTNGSWRSCFMLCPNWRDPQPQTASLILSESKNIKFQRPQCLLVFQKKYLQRCPSLT